MNERAIGFGARSLEPHIDAFHRMFLGVSRYPGERNARWLPVAMEARDDAESRDLHDWLNALPGVDFVDVVYVNFDEDEATASLTPEVNHEH